MKFQKLTIKDFLTIGEATANLDDRGLVLLQGENRDDSSQDSNGAGKSSIADAISWCLYGITARGESGNDVINNKVKRGGATVTLEINDAGNYYRIERTRLKGKGDLNVWRKDGKEWVSLTKGTIKLTQAMLDDILGCSADVFNNAIYAGQEKMPDLPGMTDKMLKLLIEEAAGILRIERAYKVARERHNDAQKAATAQQSHIEHAERLVQARRNSITRLEEQVKEWEATHKLSLADQTTKARTLKVEVEEAQRRHDTLNKDRPAIEEEIGEIGVKLASINVYHDAVRKAQSRVDGLTLDRRSAELDVKRQGEHARALKAKLENVESVAGTPCDECGKHYTEDDIAPRRTALRAELETAVEKFKVLKQQIQDIDTELSVARSDVEKAQAAVPDTTSELKRRDELSDSLRAIDRARDSAVNTAQRLRDAMTALKAEKARVNPHITLLHHEQAQLEAGQEDLRTQNEKLSKLEADVEIKKAATQVFGPAGVRAHILDTVTPFLNDRTNEYLGHLTDGNISAVWSTLDTNAKGEIKEKFAIAVKSKVGAHTFKGLSGGEKRKVRLACSMALQDLVASRATKPIDLYVADEIDHALDEAGLERLMGILQGKASDRGTVLVISHQSLSDWISNTATVVKKGGKSYLEGTALA